MYPPNTNTMQPTLRRLPWLFTDFNSPLEWTFVTTSKRLIADSNSIMIIHSSIGFLLRSIKNVYNFEIWAGISLLFWPILRHISMPESHCESSLWSADDTVLYDRTTRTDTEARYRMEITKFPVQRRVCNLCPVITTLGNVCNEWCTTRASENLVHWWKHDLFPTRALANNWPRDTSKQLRACFCSEYVFYLAWSKSFPKARFLADLPCHTPAQFTSHAYKN